MAARPEMDARRATNESKTSIIRRLLLTPREDGAIVCASGNRGSNTRETVSWTVAVYKSGCMLGSLGNPTLPVEGRRDRKWVTTRWVQAISREDQVIDLEPSETVRRTLTQVR